MNKKNTPSAFLRANFVLNLLLFSIAVSAQNDTSYVYFNSEWKEVSSDAPYQYYRKLFKQDSLWIVYDYFADGELQMNAQFLDSTLKKYQGNCTWYFQDGKIAQQGNYQSGKRIGYWQINDEAYVVESSGNYVNGKRFGVWKYKWINDYSGTQNFEADSLISGEYYRKGKLLPGNQYPSKEAQYPGGMSKMYKALYASIEYPKVAKRAGIQGKVFVEFVVDDKGKVQNVKLLKGIGGGCDEEALNAVKNLGTWIPAEMFGMHVQQRFRLPLKFQLVDSKTYRKDKRKYRKNK